MASQKTGDISVCSEKVRYQDTVVEYEFRMCPRRRFPWWVLLLLLPLLLLIRCQKELTVQCVEAETEASMAYQDVTLDYVDHFIWKSGRWFSSDSLSYTQKTDTAGVAVFKGLPCSVYSYVVYALMDGKVSARDECYAPAEKLFCFHYRRHVRLEMEPRREDLRIRVVDDETGDPIPDAVVSYQYKEQGRDVLDSVKVDAAGVATLPQMRYCSQIEAITGSSYGYYDKTRTGVSCRELLFEQDSTDLRLKPLKDRFFFFVKNAKTKEPIPDAICDVVLTRPGVSRSTISGQVRTSIDGKGMAVYTGAPILSTIAIKASKVNYRDSVLTDGPNGPWTVVEFIRQDEETRTIWLNPDPYLLEFVNVDSLTRKPIPGVRNEITITHPDGTRTVLPPEISNRDGVFPISAAQDDKVEVVSSKGGEYQVKHTIYPRFKDVMDKEIRMMPEMVELSFLTVMEEDHSVLLPDCNLQVTGSISGPLPPSSSGSGMFEVTMRKAETISITAWKTGFKTNDTKVRNKDWAYLQAPQDRRIIPLERATPPVVVRCSDVEANNSDRDRGDHAVGEHSLGKPGAFLFKFYTDSHPDIICVYDGTISDVRAGKARLLFAFGEDGEATCTTNYRNPRYHKKLYSKAGVVTVTVDNGSNWGYIVTCPK